MNVLDLFSGIGGFSLGLERAGMKTTAFCEIDPFCRNVLVKHWPDVPIYEDVKNVTADQLKADGINVDVITGGFPCQDLSVAGKQAGIDGERSGLWSELARIIGEVRPQYAIVENVTNLLAGPSEQRGGWFGRVLGDLASIGYDAEWHCIPASELGAHHHRDRVWIVGYPKEIKGNVGNSISKSSQQVQGFWEPGRASIFDNVAHANGKRGRCGNASRKDAEDARKSSGDSWHYPERMGIWDVEPNVGRVANGVPQRVDRLGGLGNAVAPQIPEFIGNAIMERMNKLVDTQI